MNEAVLTGALVAASPVRTRRRGPGLALVLGLGCPALLLLGWQILVWTGGIDGRFFPPPSRILTAAVLLLADPVARDQLLGDAGATAQRLVAGYALGATVGTVTGMAMARFLPLRFAIGPLVSATYPTPKLALFPLLVVLLGLGDASKIVLVSLGVFFMCCMSTFTGVRTLPTIYSDAATAFRIPAWTRWTQILLPAALPSIITGLKLGLGQALTLVVSVEMVSSQDGIGHFIWESWQILDIPRMFVGIAVVMASGGCAVMLGDAVERRLTPWAQH